MREFLGISSSYSEKLTHFFKNTLKNVTTLFTKGWISVLDWFIISPEMLLSRKQAPSKQTTVNRTANQMFLNSLKISIDISRILKIDHLG